MATNVTNIEHKTVKMELGRPFAPRHKKICGIETTRRPETTKRSKHICGDEGGYQIGEFDRHT